MSTIDCHKEMKGFHAAEVTLPKPEQDEMRGRRNAGRTRLKSGLAAAKHAAPKDIASQGSYAMRTMVQDDDSDYDIDDGAYFEKEDLKKSDGSYLSAPEARQRVRNALKDDRLAYDAVVKENCVRQKYPEGYHIDIPVYRIVRTEDAFGSESMYYELASGDDWVKQDARAVTSWYNNAIGQELKSGESDTSQTRRVTKLTKKLARSRGAWKAKTTTGICISKLVIDYMACVTDRDDDAVRKTWEAIKARLDLSVRISHPVDQSKNLAEEGDEDVSFFRDCLGGALKKLEVLDKLACTKHNALDAWDGVFNTTYFSAQIDADVAKSLLKPAAAAAGLSFPSRPVVPNKSSGFA
ncbi:MAG: cyclic GMP-AMP synthase DncV-like nucleotidyltransferase [Rudaea sp.]